MTSLEERSYLTPLFLSIVRISIMFGVPVWSEVIAPALCRVVAEDDQVVVKRLTNKLTSSI